MAGNIQVGDVGTAFQIRVLKPNGQPWDLSITTALEIRFEKPGTEGIVLVKPATVEPDPENGNANCIAQYIIGAGDIDVHGGWLASARATFTTGVWNTKPKRFRVDEPIPVNDD
jgi:hypothetical protein